MRAKEDSSNLIYPQIILYLTANYHNADLTLLRCYPGYNSINMKILTTI